MISCVACTSTSGFLRSPDQQARSLLSAQKFHVVPPSAAVAVPLLAAIKPAVSAPRRLTVFIESDGSPWPRPSLPPADPTPSRPLALHLAAAYLPQPDEAVAYLGRPCQYLSAAQVAACPVQWWTIARFGAEPLALLNRQIDVLKAEAAGAALQLVGYSGGGTVAALLAARRGDVACLVTVAAPLDTSAWTLAMKVSPLRESHNPADVALALQKLRMTHFSGSFDAVVPAGVNALFMARARTQETVQAGFSHDAGWLDAWPALARSSCLEAQDIP